MSDMDQRDTEDAQHHQAMQEIEREALEALRASRIRPLTDDEAMLLAWHAGLSGAFYKEIRQ